MENVQNSETGMDAGLSVDLHGDGKAGKPRASKPTKSAPGYPGKRTALRKNNIIIRLAKPEDLEPARAIARALHEKTIFAHIPWSDRKFDRQFAEVLKLPPNKAGLIAERGGIVLGFAYLTCGDYFVGEGHVVTSVQAIAIDGDNLPPTTRTKTFIRLVKGAKKWAKTRAGKGKSEMVLINVTTGVKLRATDRLLRLAGAKCVGGGYVV